MRTIKTPTNLSSGKKIIFFISILFFSTSCLKQVIPIPPGGGGGGSSNPPPPYTTTSKIIYTDVNPDSIILSTTDSFNLDLNNDGTPDFVFHRSSFSTQCGGHNPDPEVRETYGFFSSFLVTPASASNAIMASASNSPLALDSATSINADSLWRNTAQILLEAKTTTCVPIPVHVGYWLNVTDKYIGLKIIKGSDTYYGWARLSSTYSLNASSILISGGQLIIKDYAYNSNPGQPILAGQTK